MRNTVQALVILSFVILGCEPSARANTYNDIELDRRISFLEEQMGRINGKLEEINYSLQILQSNSTSSVANSINPNTIKMSVDTGTIGPVIPSESLEIVKPVPEPVQEVNTLPNGDAQKDYDRAIAFLHKGNYVQAERALNTFIKKYPRHALNVNAKYWLGETYLIQSRFADSAIMFGEVYQIFHQQNNTGAAKDKIKQSRAKAPEALIKLVFALKGLRKEQDACATLAQLAEEFPQLPKNLIKLAEKAQSGLRCR